MLSVGDRVTNNLQVRSATIENLPRETLTHIFEEDLENTTSLFVDETGDTFHTTTTSEAANGRLCDTLDVVAENLAMTLSTTFAKSLPSKLPLAREEKKDFKSTVPFHLFHGQTYFMSLEEGKTVVFEW